MPVECVAAFTRHSVSQSKHNGTPSIRRPRCGEQKCKSSFLCRVRISASSTHHTSVSPRTSSRIKENQDAKIGVSCDTRRFPHLDPSVYRQYTTLPPAFVPTGRPLGQKQTVPNASLPKKTHSILPPSPRHMYQVPYPVSGPNSR